MFQEDPIQLRLWYWELHKKEQVGRYSKTDAYYLIYVCSELEEQGYVLNEDGSDWLLPPQVPNSDHKSQ